MFVAIYRWRLHEGREAEFADHWQKGTLLFREEQGALGSRLHRAEDGSYFAYAQWPSRAAYHAEKKLTASHRENLEAMRACVKESFPVILGEMEADLLLPPTSS